VERDVPLKPRLAAADPLDRHVLFAVELVDPVTHALVCEGVKVEAAGLAGRPIVSRSGRFVWLEEGSAWPDRVSVDTGRLPYERHVALAPPRPPDPAAAGAEARRLRVLLRPSVAYPVEDGITAIRGRLFEDASRDAAPLPGARVQLAWRDEAGDWFPAPPAAEGGGEAGADAPSPSEQETNAAGEFLVFLHLRPRVGTEPDLADGRYLAVRLQVTRGRSIPDVRVTPDGFPFLPSGDDPQGTRVGRVREGRVLARDVRLAWSDLVPV
jgi:hypothetical protein